MDAALNAQPSEGILAELAALTGRFRALCREVERLPGVSFDRVSVCANDGEFMYVGLADTEISETPAVNIGQFSLEEVTRGLEGIETECAALRAESNPEADRKLAAMDQDVVELLKQHATAPCVPSAFHAVHTQFAGRKGALVWSVYLEMDPVRALACGVDAGELCTQIIVGRDRPEDGGLLVHHAGLVDADLPLAVFFNRHIQQLRAQGLSPAIVLVANRGILISATTGKQIEEMYETASGRISAFGRAHQDADHPEKPYELAGRRNVLDAEKALFKCVEDMEIWHSWVPEKGSDLHQLLCSQEQMAQLREGFPTEALVRRGGGAPLVVNRGKSDSAERLAQSMETAWKEYHERYVNKLHVVQEGENHFPKIILVEGVSAITVGDSEEELVQAYAVLLESIAVMKDAVPFGGQLPLPEERQKFVLMAAN